MGATARGFAVTSDEEGRYTIEGTVDTTESGWTVELDPDNEGVVPDPKRAVFRLTATPPEIGQPVITEVPVRHPFSDSSELETVDLRLVGLTTSSGEREVTLPVPRG